MAARFHLIENRHDQSHHRLGIVHPGPPPDELSAIQELTP